MNTAKTISTRMRNLMNAHIGKTYNQMDGNNIVCKVTIKSLMGNTGYFVTEVSDSESTWQSNASYGEITNGLKKGDYIEA